MAKKKRGLLEGRTRAKAETEAGGAEKKFLSPEEGT